MSTDRLQALIFDVDGTLAETEEHHRRAFNEAFGQMGLDWVWDEALYRQLLRVTGGKERILAFAGRFSPDILEEVRRLTPDLHRLKTSLYTAAVREGKVTLRPGMARLIADARAAGLRCAIATTTTLDNVMALLTATMGPNWREIFPVVAAGDMVARKKPAPDVYNLALERLGLTAQVCLAIEDSRNGVEAARAASLNVVAVRSNYAIEDDLSGAARIFTDPESLSLEAISKIFLTNSSLGSDRRGQDYPIQAG